MIAQKEATNKGIAQRAKQEDWLMTIPGIVAIFAAIVIVIGNLYVTFDEWVGQKIDRGSKLCFHPPTTAELWFARLTNLALGSFERWLLPLIR